MKLELIEEYKILTGICASTDYADKASVKRHNNSVRKMYKIVETIGKGKTEVTIEQFSELLEVTKQRTNLWAAVQLLERVSVNNETKEKALAIIRKAAAGDSAEAMGFQFWLNDWQEKMEKKVAAIK